MWRSSARRDRRRGAAGPSRKLRPDVMLMDIGLPDQSGIDATRAIKRATRRRRSWR